MSTMRVWLLLVLTCALVLVTSPAHGARRTWTVLAGGETKDHAVQAQGFYPNSIEIAVGDTVRWKIAFFHTVTFTSGQEAPPLEMQEGDRTRFNPDAIFPAGGNTYDGTGYRNSGGPPEFPKIYEYSLTFTKAGTYKYVCLAHRGMAGNVTVKEKPAGSPEAVLARARAQQAAAVRAGSVAWAAKRPQRMGSEVVVRLEGGLWLGYSLLRFTPRPIVIGPGETVTWKMEDPLEIHAVTFPGGRKSPEFAVVEEQKGGPPKIFVNPVVQKPTAGRTYRGGFANSGILFAPGAGPSGAPSQFSLTFTRAGRYEYICPIHMPIEGMKGIIIVK